MIVPIESVMLQILLRDYPQSTAKMIGLYLSLTITRSMMTWHQIPGAITVCIQFSARAGVLLLKGEMWCVCCQ